MEAATLELHDGRTLTVVPNDVDDLVEVRSGDGTLELRIRMTAEGPVLEMESVRLKLSAKESVDVETKDFNVNAQGDITVSGKADVHVDGAGEVRVTGEMIYLN
jgi:hypothetical protein